MPRTRRHQLDRPDATIAYWTAGRPADPAVVLLHGATLDHRAWDPQTDALAHRCHVVVPDLRGHGASTGRFDYRAAVADVLALLDRLPAERVVLVGLSLGGNIAQDVVHREPDRVLALVGADTTCNTASRHPLAGPMAVAAVRAQAMSPGDGFARQAARVTANDPRVQQYALETNAHRTNGETVHILSSLLTTAFRADPGYRLPVPTLLVHGELDRIGDIASAMPAWARREPRARYAVVPGAGHASNLDNPEGFTALLEDFLDDVLPDEVLGERAEQR